VAINLTSPIEVYEVQSTTNDHARIFEYTYGPVEVLTIANVKAGSFHRSDPKEVTNRTGKGSALRLLVECPAASLVALEELLDGSNDFTVRKTIPSYASNMLVKWPLAASVKAIRVTITVQHRGDVGVVLQVLEVGS
jgi:hypothetical protein